MGKHLYLLGYLFLMVINGFGHPILQKDTTIDQPSMSFDQLDNKALHKLDKKYSNLGKEIDGQSIQLLNRMEKQEMRLQNQLILKDSMAAKKVFGDAKATYEKWKNKLQTPVTGIIPRPLQEYVPRLDSLQTVMRFLGQPGSGLPTDKLQQIQGLSGHLQQLQEKWQQAGAIQGFVKQREQLLTDQLTKYGMTNQLSGMNKEVYYYQQRLAEYKKTLSDPSKMGDVALGMVRQLPVFQKFMQKNSYLGQLFPMPQNYGTPQALAGVPTSADVGNMIAQKLGTTDSKIDPQQYLQQQAQSGQDQLSALKDKVAKAGGSNSDMEIPQFTPNSQKTKSFLHRLEYGFNVQSQSSTVLLPTITVFAAMLGYKIDNGATAGVGVSYNMGWGNGLNHIALSNEGIGLRSFLDIRAKGSIWVTGGFEYNYIQEFAKLADLKNLDVWQKSALLGLTKKYKVGKQTGNLQLLYDFLAHYEIPQGSALKFRVGYTF
jgi:hypothetical protein